MIKKSMQLSFVLLACANLAYGAAVHHTFTTQLKEVRTGHFNGKEYLSIQIPGKVGPANCRGNVLKIDLDNFKSEDDQYQIESVALSAMLNDDSVLITVPLGFSDCVDGKPTVLEMYLLDNL